MAAGRWPLTTATLLVLAASVVCASMLPPMAEHIVAVWAALDPRHVAQDTSTAASVAMVAGQDGIAGLQPAPMFAVFQPTYLPSGFRLISSTYAPGVIGNSKPPVQGPVITTTDRHFDPTDDEADIAVEATSRIAHLLGDQRQASLVQIYARPKGERITLVQHAAAVTTLSTGDAASVHSAQAVFSVLDNNQVLTWVEKGSQIEISTELSRSELLQFAEGLQQLVLAPFTTPAIATPIPLAGRVDLVETPRTNRDTIIAACGSWDSTLWKKSLTLTYRPGLCVAQFIAGMKDDGTADWLSWSVAAGRLGVSKMPGPPSDRTVALFVIGSADRAGAAVVLDPETGEPYVLARLKGVRDRP